MSFDGHEVGWMWELLHARPFLSRFFEMLNVRDRSALGLESVWDCLGPTVLIH